MVQGRTVSPDTTSEEAEAQGMLRGRVAFQMRLEQGFCSQRLNETLSASQADPRRQRRNKTDRGSLQQSLRACVWSSQPRKPCAHSFGRIMGFGTMSTFIVWTRVAVGGRITHLTLF